MDGQKRDPEVDLQKRYPSIGEIIGLQNEDTAEGAAFRRRLELRFKSEDDFRKLPLRDQYLWHVCEYDNVVQNGGIHEFLRRPAGVFAIETLEALEAIGAQSASLGLRQVLDLFPGNMPSRDQAERQRQIDEICVSFPEISGNRRPFLDAIKTHRVDENIYELLMDYWHRQGESST